MVSNPSLGSVELLLGGGGGGHLAPQHYGAGSGASLLSIADLNGDGSPDLVVADSLSSSVAVLLNTTQPVAVRDDFRDAGLALAPPYPNPAHEIVTSVFTLPRSERVELRVRDLAGRMIRVVASDRFTAGRHVLRWDARTARGTPAAPGLYFLELRAESDVRVRRLVLR